MSDPVGRISRQGVYCLVAMTVALAPGSALAQFLGQGEAGLPSEDGQEALGGAGGSTEAASAAAHPGLPPPPEDQPYSRVVPGATREWMDGTSLYGPNNRNHTPYDLGFRASPEDAVVQEIPGNGKRDVFNPALDLSTFQNFLAHWKGMRDGLK